LRVILWSYPTRRAKSQVDGEDAHRWVYQPKTNRQKKMMRQAAPLLGRFTTTPIELFRIQTSKTVSLRDYAAQMARKRISFDLQTHNGLVLPRNGPNFDGPNGMSLRPNGPVLQEFIRVFQSRKPHVYRIPQGAIRDQS
jgi:hypothetical protein